MEMGSHGSSKNTVESFMLCFVFYYSYEATQN